MLLRKLIFTSNFTLWRQFFSLSYNPLTPLYILLTSCSRFRRDLDCGRPSRSFVTYSSKMFPIRKNCAMNILSTPLWHHLFAPCSFELILSKWYQFGLCGPYTVLTNRSMRHSVLFCLINVKIALIIAFFALLVHHVCSPYVIVACTKRIVLFFTISHLLYLRSRI